MFGKAISKTQPEIPAPAHWHKACISTSITWARQGVTACCSPLEARTACVGRQSSIGKANVIFQNEVTTGVNRYILC